MYWPLCLISTEDELIIRMNSSTNSASFVASRGDPLGQPKKIIDYDVDGFQICLLDYFFPATRTNTLKKEIQGATQEDDETLSQYWGRFKGMLDACPNNRMTEVEIYNNFYEGMTPECKDLVNSASGGDFSKLRVSEAKRILSRLINANKVYDSPRTTLLRRGTVNAASEQPEDKMEARMDKLEKAIISALEKTKQPTPTEKCQAPLGQEESWSDANQNQPASQAQIFRLEWRDHLVGQAEIPKGQTNWATEVKAKMPTGPAAISPTGGRASQQPPGGQALYGRYNQGHGASGNFHPQQGQGYNNYQYQQENSHFNQGPGYNQYASGSGQPFPRQQQKLVDDLVGDLLNTQQNLHSNIQANNDVVHKLQDAQREQKAARDMIAQQLSQIATSLNEMRGNEGRTPATVKTPGKKNISQIILRSEKAYEGPIMQTEHGESSSRGGIDGKLIKETGQGGENIELRREDIGGTASSMGQPIFSQSRQ
ncbi:hypothetical protein AAHA92_06938 [Salvia divinorum]|uniref:Retrotransposon gag domain-containing protein n=1 Tax=Salvia divinorum TaxID=28513 RepID=A0ABD1I7B6_SALDI